MVKIKEKEKRDKYLDLAKEVRKLWNMRMMAISIVIGMFGIIHKGLEKRTGRIGNQSKNQVYPD